MCPPTPVNEICALSNVLLFKVMTFPTSLLPCGCMEVPHKKVEQTVSTGKAKGLRGSPIM